MIVARVERLSEMWLDGGDQYNGNTLYDSLSIIINSKKNKNNKNKKLTTLLLNKKLLCLIMITKSA